MSKRPGLRAIVDTILLGVLFFLFGLVIGGVIGSPTLGGAILGVPLGVAISVAMTRERRSINAASHDKTE